MRKGQKRAEVLCSTRARISVLKALTDLELAKNAAWELEDKPGHAFFDSLRGAREQLACALGHLEVFRHSKGHIP